MVDTNNDIQQQLVECYTAQAAYYEAAIEIAEQLRRDFERGQSTEAAIAQLNQQIQRIAALDSKCQHAKQAWNNSGAVAGPELNAALQRVQRLLERLIPLIGVAESAAQAAKSRLAPQLNVQSRSHRMRAAYSSSAANPVR